MNTQAHPPRSHSILAAILAAIAVLGPFAAAADAGGRGPSTATDEVDRAVDVVVGFQGDPDPDVVRAHGGEVREVFDIVGAVAATVPASALGPLEREPAVASVERDDHLALAQGAVEPDGGGGLDRGTGPDLAPGVVGPDERRAKFRATDEGEQASGEGNQTIPWGVARVGATAVHENGTTGDGVVVAVLDTGIDADHPDLEGSYAGGVDIVNGDDVPEDDNGHGTHVAGTIAAADDDQGVVGVAPDVSIYGVKVLNETGEGTHSDILAGIEWAIAGPDGVVGTDDDPDIISMSLGGFLGVESVHHAIKTAYREHGVLIVAGAGDIGTMDQYDDTVMYPARYDQVIAVGAVDRNDRVPNWSGFGPRLELVAPGVAVESTAHGGIVPGCGTSMATPHVTGVAALVYASAVPPEADTDGDGEWDAHEVRARLRDTAVDIGPEGRDDSSGFGRVWAPAAVGVSTENQPPMVSTAELELQPTNLPVVTIRAAVTDRESDVGDLDVIVVVDGRRQVTAAYDPNVGVFEATIDPRWFRDAGSHQFVVIVRDEQGALDSEVIVTVTRIAAPPLLAPEVLTNASVAPIRRFAPRGPAGVPVPA